MKRALDRKDFKRTESRVDKKSVSKFSVKPTIFLIVYLLTAIIAITLTISKYVSTKASENVARVAVMANASSVNIDLSDGVYPGFESVHTIELSNIEDDEVCDVAQKFIINIENDEFENIPLDYEIYKDENCTEQIEKDEDGNFSSDDFIFNAGVEEEKKYFLKIKWPEDKNDEKYAFEIGYCTINIAATQID